MIKRRIVVVVLVGAVAAGISVAAQKREPAAGGAPWTQPRMPWGDPDLEGVWTSDNNFSIPLERPAEVANKEFLDGQDLEKALKSRARFIDAIADGGGGVSSVAGERPPGSGEDLQH